MLKEALLLVAFGTIVVSGIVHRPTKYALEYQRKVKEVTQRLRSEGKIRKVAHPREIVTPYLPFPCTPIPPSATKPTSAHAVRPSDINIVAAIGDSITAGNGIDSTDMIDVAWQNRGHSWCIGGDDSFEDPQNVTTDPNILKKYNSGLKGWSSGRDTDSTEPEARLNVAIPGEVASGMFAQAQTLIDKIEDDPEYDKENDWKLVTLLIGGNDLCQYCNDRDRYNAEEYVRHIRLALDELHANLPRTIVNLNPMFDITPLKTMSTGEDCDIFQESVCPCGVDDTIKDEIKEVARQYSTGIRDLVQSGRYDDKEDFTVVYQSHMQDAKPPQKPGSNEPDRSYWAHDCFHPGTKAHYAMATSLWNNMFEPVGKKRLTVTWEIGKNMICPTEAKPYIYTNKNSGSQTGASHSQPQPDYLVKDRIPDEEIEISGQSIRDPGQSGPQGGAAIGLSVAGVVLAVVGITCLVASLVIIRKRRNTETQKPNDRLAVQNPAFTQNP